MRNRLIEVGLWNQKEGLQPGNDIISAWSVVSRLGYPGRYGGKAPDGRYEYLIVNPKTGRLSSGKGDSVTTAMCEAAIEARILERSISN